jgi:hypothetical protein
MLRKIVAPGNGGEEVPGQIQTKQPCPGGHKHLRPFVQVVISQGQELQPT